MNCQKPDAPEGLTTWLNPLSMTARYLKSAGTPSSSKIGSINGNHAKPLEVQNGRTVTVGVDHELAIQRFAHPEVWSGTGSPNNVKSLGIVGEITGACFRLSTSNSNVCWPQRWCSSRHRCRGTVADGERFGVTVKVENMEDKFPQEVTSNHRIPGTVSTTSGINEPLNEKDSHNKWRAEAASLGLRHPWG